MPLDVFALGLDPQRGLRARWDDGSVLALPVARWLGGATAEEEAVLDRAVGPVLDVGCGPGRHVLALRRRGVEALGIDVSADALRFARRRGAPVLEASVFDGVPDAGRWATCLLLDGNIGIGGDAPALLARLGALMAPGGRVLVEVEPPGAPTVRTRVRLETAGRRSSGFAWARVGADGVEAVAAHAGLDALAVWSTATRWFAELRTC